MKLLTEFVGSFLFMLAIAFAAIGGSPIAPVAIGCALMVMVYMGGHISGGHYNPAVSLGAMLRGKLPAKDLAPYWLAQILGSLAAFGVGYWVSGLSVNIAPGAGIDAARALTVEAFFTMALVLVVLNTATCPETEGNSFYGLAIGFTIVVAAIAGGPFSGGAFNPAVAIGATAINATQSGGTWGNLWIYVVGPLLGGVLAALVYKLQHCGD